MTSNIQDYTNNEYNSHQHTLYSENIVSVGNFHITNSLLNTWITLFIILLISLFIKKNISIIPNKIQSLIEIIIESFLNIFDSITNDRKKTWLIFPFVFSFFLFILINNWLGVLPGSGSIIIENKSSVISLFRGGTADLNTTLALAIIAVLVSNIVGIISIGLWNYINKFINIQAIIDIPKKILKDPMIIILSPINFFVGLLEIISEVAKIISLSFRLFGNIFAGEVLLTTMFTIFAYILPIPFLLMEILVGFIQAFIFMMLVLVYIDMNTRTHDNVH